MVDKGWIIVLLALYRRVSATGAISTVLWIVALLSLLIVIVASLTNFHTSLAFTYPHNAFAFGGPFWAELGGGLLIGLYDYLGYNTTSYMAAEIKDPGRVLPRSILYSVLGIMVAYLAMNIGVLGTVPWQVAAKSQSVGSLVLDRTWGKAAAGITTVLIGITTVLIVFTAFGSIFAGLMGGSRVPYNAARLVALVGWIYVLHLLRPHSDHLLAGHPDRRPGGRAAGGAGATRWGCVSVRSRDFVIAVDFGGTKVAVVSAQRAPGPPTPARWESARRRPGAVLEPRHRGGRGPAGGACRGSLQRTARRAAARPPGERRQCVRGRGSGDPHAGGSGAG